MVTTKKKEKDYGDAKIFVYGTLKQRGCNNMVLKLAGAHFLGYDYIDVQGGVFMDLGAFPALVWPIEGSQADSQIIQGEVWYGPAEALKSCDILEGHPLFFSRSKHWTKIHRKRAWVYSLPETWIAEGNDFLTGAAWKPDKIEQEFWDSQTEGVV